MTRNQEIKAAQAKLNVEKAVDHLEYMITVADQQIATLAKDRAPEFIANNIRDAKAKWGELVNGLPIPGLFRHQDIVDRLERADLCASPRYCGRYSINPQTDAVMGLFA